MKANLTHHLMATLLGVAFTAELHAQTSAFTYQDQLTENGTPASGIYDLQFTRMVAAAGAGFAQISWTPDTGTNWVLQQTAELSPVNWTNSPSGFTNSNRRASRLANAVLSVVQTLMKQLPSGQDGHC